MGNLVNSCEGIEVAFHNALRYAVNYLACEQSDTSLEVSTGYIHVHILVYLLYVYALCVCVCIRFQGKSS